MTVFMCREDLSSLSIPIDKCFCVNIGIIDSEVVQEMKVRNFDQAPVSGSHGQIIGLIERAKVEWICDNGVELEESSESITRSFLASESSIIQLLECLTETRSILLQRDNETFAFINYSDLNRYRFRAKIYPGFAEIEVRMADLVQNAYSDHWQWLKNLSDERKANILGYRAVAEYKNVETTFTDGLYFSDLINIVKAKDSPLRKYIEDDRVTLRFGQLINLRNIVMHPVRPLVSKPEGVQALLSNLRFMNSLMHALDRFREEST